MAAYTSIRGWIEVNESTLKLIQKILTDHISRAEEFGITPEHAEFYNQGWIIPDEHINWTHYIFYGADIRTQAVDFILSQMKSITAITVNNGDDYGNWDVNTDYYPTGKIHVHEDGTFEHPDELWEIDNGQLLVTKTHRS